MAAVSAFFLVLERSMGRRVDFFRARNLSHACLALGIIVLVTAYATGGIGLAVFGARSAGGKRYLYIFLALALYFGRSSSLPIKRKFAGLAMAPFFLLVPDRPGPLSGRLGGHRWFQFPRGILSD